MRIGSGAILYAVKKRWTAMKLDTVFTGGLHLGTASRRTQTPYCVLNVAAESVFQRASSGDFKQSEYTTVLLDFVTFHEAGLQAAEDAADAIRLKFDNVPLVLQTGEGKILYFRWVSSVPVQLPQDNPNVWAYTVTYEVLRHRDEVVN